MKKHFGKTAICAVLISVFLLLLTPQRAMAVSASLTGSSSVKAGDSVVLTLSVSGNIHGLSGTLSVGSGLTFTNYDCADSSMTLTVNGNNFAAYGTSATTGKIITVTLKVDSGLSAGTELSASFKDITVSDGESDSTLSTASWSGTVAAKPSSECHLTAIRCSNATLSPAFNKDTTYYTANVPYSVSKLSLDYDRADKNGSSVTISDTSLAVGANTITLKVTAADGTTKTYTLSVTRQQDPNYKPKTEASLKELKLDKADISPAFSEECTDYVAYVPFETKEVTLSGAAKDEKAVTSGEKTVKLTKEGATDVSVVCTAEDGKTTKTYTVHVYRMPEYKGILPVVEVRESTETDVPTVTDAEVIPTLSVPATVKLPLLGSASTILVGVILLVIVLVLLFLLAFLIGRSRREDYEDDSLEEEPSRQTGEAPPRRVQPACDAEPISEPLPKRVQTEPAAEELPAEECLIEPGEPEVPKRMEESDEIYPEEEAVQPLPSQLPADEDARAAEKEAENMSLDELLKDIRDM